jgi:hypothetical protein
MLHTPAPCLRLEVARTHSLQKIVPDGHANQAPQGAQNHAPIGRPKPLFINSPTTTHLFIKEAACAHELVGEAHPATTIKRKGDNLTIAVEGVTTSRLQDNQATAAEVARVCWWSHNCRTAGKSSCLCWPAGSLECWQRATRSALNCHSACCTAPTKPQEQESDASLGATLAKPLLYLHARPIAQVGAHKLLWDGALNLHQGQPARHDSS